MILDAEALLVELLCAAERRPDIRERALSLFAPPAPKEPQPVYLKPGEVAVRYSVSRRTVFTWLRGGLASCGAGPKRRIAVRDADAFFASWQERESTPDAIERRARHSATMTARRREKREIQ